MKIRGTTVATPISRAAVTKDNEVSKKPWSSKHTVDTLCPTFTESGSVVACEPVEGYPLGVEWKTKNLCTQGTMEVGHYVNIWSGSISAPITISADVSQVIPDPTKAGAAFLGVTVDGTMKYVTLDELKNGGVTYSTGTITNVKIMNWCDATGTVTFQIEEGTVATAYEPYAETATITRCGKNIFGGEAFADIMVEKGATKDAEAGTIHWNPRDCYNTKIIFDKFKENTQYTFVLFGRNTISGNKNYLNLYVVYTNGQADYIEGKETGTDEMVVLTSRAGATISFFQTTHATGQTTLYYDKCGIFEGVIEADDFEPHQAETFVIGEPITALQGVNTIYADVGFVTVTGKADPTVIIQDLCNKVNALSATVTALTGV